ncbi:MAG: M15 family peptidase, partial [Fibrobacteria bacterium]
MKLGERQELFSRLIAKLILKMYDMGYQVRMGDVWAKPRNPLEHKANSLHYEKCAADLNLFQNGKFLDKTSDHANFGDYWETLHPNCRW